MRLLLKLSFYLIVVLALFFIPVNLTKYQSRDEIIYTSVFDLTEQDTAWVESQLQKLSLREKIAQMVFPYAMGRDSNVYKSNYARLTKLVIEEKVGGILFLQGDIKNQIAISNKLQQLSDIPLLITADYEHGVGMRLEDGVNFPFNMAVCAAGDPNLTYKMGKIIGSEGRALGVHQNFAPLVDVNHDPNNPIINIRAYSSDPYLISAHATSFIRGMKEGKMLSTAKHFPGHGATDIDSHNDLPVIVRTKSELEQSDLIPFREAIKTGVNAVMTGHLEVPAYEKTPGLPATLSQNIITELLQNQLEFDGLIVTDAMNMNSILKFYSQAEAAKLAVIAGNDIILFPYKEKECIDGIEEAVNHGEITEERINKSVRKILAAKKWLGLNENKLVDPVEVEKQLNKKFHYRLADEISEKSITLIKDEAGIIPINPNDYYATASIILSDSKNPTDYLIKDLVEKNFNYTRSYILSTVSKKNEYNETFNFASKANIIILSAFVNVRDFQGTIDINENHLKFINRLKELKKPIVFLNFGNPFILSKFPEVETYLASFGGVDASQSAMMNAILGNRNITGKLPISIPGTDFEIGHGIIKNTDKLFVPKILPDSLYDFTRIDDLMNECVKDSVFPGGVLLIGHRGKIIYEKAFGRFTYDKISPEMTTNAMFDLASVSKVVGTTSAAMMLVSEGKINTQEKVSYYLPEFANNEKENITIKNLLLHNSGLTSWKPFYKKFNTAKEIINDIMNSGLEYETGSKTLYSDLGMITLQKVIEKVSGKPLDNFLKERLFEPINMKRTMYNPPPEFWYYCPPTEVDNYWRMMTLKGKVHDETAYMLNGVAGHAGLFSTARDLSTFLFTLLNKGRYDTLQLFDPKIVEEWTTKQSRNSSRGLGWDTKSESASSAGIKFSDSSFGHTGFTGTSVWVDKERDLFVILLTNRVHPSRDNTKIIKFRPQLHDEVINAVDYFTE